ncbi:MAG: hypothetical protein ACLQPD_00370 [Desulfomonilaceae bacterium]
MVTDEPKRRNYRATLLNLDPEVWKKIKEAAWDGDLSANSLARRFLRQGLERYLSNESRKAA